MRGFRHTYVVVGVLPVRETGKSLNNFDTFPGLCEGANSELMGELLARLEDLGFEEFTASHYEGREEKGAF